jgi:hypothetical protein
MRASSLACFLILLAAAAPTRALAEPLAETLTGTWTCQARENSGEADSDIAMTLTYRRSGHFLVGEIVEDNGAALLDIWLDSGSGAAPLSLRRIISYDATIEMNLVEEAPTWIKLEGEMRHILGSTAKVREVFRFTGTEEFRALWEADSGEGWKLIMDRSCRRI